MPDKVEGENWLPKAVLHSDLHMHTDAHACQHAHTCTIHAHNTCARVYTQAHVSLWSTSRCSLDIVKHEECAVPPMKWVTLRFNEAVCLGFQLSPKTLTKESRT